MMIYGEYRVIWVNSKRKKNKSYFIRESVPILEVNTFPTQHPCSVMSENGF